MSPCPNTNHVRCCSAGACWPPRRQLDLAAEPPFPVAEVQLQTLPDEQVLDGVVEAVNQSTVSAQTAGRVEEIMVDVNDFVSRQGAPIVRIRNIEQRAGLEQAQASLREAQARHIEAEAEYNRIRGVYERQLVSRAQMDTATAAIQCRQGPAGSRSGRRRPGARNRWATPPSTRPTAESFWSVM
jgi:multidrug efflux pump subunit AcrA (membrane-fusion protein)